ncbi:MAG: NADPH-dependent FMN reductase [Pararhodobacter sp.]
MVHPDLDFELVDLRDQDLPFFDEMASNRKPMAALAYSSMGGARALEHLRLIAIELQMVPLRNAIHIGAADFFKVSPLGEDATLGELTFWAKLLKDAPKS